LRVPSRVTGCVVEAGCFKGSSTAKFSLGALAAGRKLFVFDSFEGIPAHKECHKVNIFGRPVSFPKGSYCGHVDEVKANVARFGAPDVCVLVKGWFEDTMPRFSEPIIAAYIDVDLVSSTRTCLKYLFPLLIPGGVLFSQDGHLPLVVELLGNDRFWEDEIGCSRPHIDGLGTRKLVRIIKPVD
jgi:O-methyltransferase